MQSRSSKKGALTLGAMGVVYGDIGTSPLYAFKQCFVNPAHGLEPGRDEIFGVLSLIFWSVTLVVTIKYVVFVTRADNHGEGGTLSLLALASRATSNPRVSALLAVLGIFAAALFYGDSMLTPAISVISAVEGLQLLAPQLEHYVLPVTVGILSALFMLQRRGTASIGSVFGPVMATWFAVLAGLGLWHIASSPGILAALNPWYAVRLFDEHSGAAYVALGSVVLALTGAEALYADMGHFGKGPIRIAWLGFVSPALILNYFGQGALVLANPEYLENPLYRMVPAWALLPLIILAAMATVTASQAVISGAFSVTRQAFQQKLLPRIMTIHTSASEEGQIYIPFINWSLFVAVIALVLGFGSSSAMAGAYGVAVTGTMLIDTLLLAVVMLCTWKWNRVLMVATLTVFLVVDIAYFSANLMKVPHGGWFPLVIGLVIFTLLTTWRAGRGLLVAQLRREALPIEVFLQALADVQRVPGTAVFLTSNPEGTPPALLHNMKHNKVVHETVVLLTVRTRDHAQAPRREERLEITPLGGGFYRAQLAFGYLEDQAVPETLRALAPPELPLDPMQTSYFLSRETLLPARRSSMSRWRLALFAWMVRNAATPLKTFHLPPNRVVELGQQIGI